MGGYRIIGYYRERGEGCNYLSHPTKIKHPNLLGLNMKNNPILDQGFVLGQVVLWCCWYLGRSWKAFCFLGSCPKILPWQARQRLEKRGYCVRGTKVGMVRHSVGPNYACVGMFLSWMQQQQHVLPLWLVVVLYWRGSTANPHIWVMFSPTHETRTIDTVLAIITINYSILTLVLYIYIYNTYHIISLRGGCLPPKSTEFHLGLEVFLSCCGACFPQALSLRLVEFLRILLVQSHPFAPCFAYILYNNFHIFPCFEPEIETIIKL